jgi:hypothetical protein
MLTCKFDNYMGELLKILIIKWVSKRAAENSQQSSVRQSITFPRNFHVYLCISMPVLPPTYVSKFRSRSSKIYNLSRNSHCLDLIYCAGDNERLTRIAHEAGFLIGIRSGRAAHGFPVRFVDIEYRKPNFGKHLTSVKRHWPKYATVLDLSEDEVSQVDIERALVQYREMAVYCEIPLIVPKLPGQVAMLPDDIAIGYSIPTSYGGAKVSIVGIGRTPYSSPEWEST